jgi:hypothetical protein
VTENAPIHLINSIRIDPSKARSYKEFETDLRSQLEASARRFEKLKATISNLTRFTRDIRGFVDVDLLEEKADRFKPNMDVVRSLRLVKYVLSTMIYLTKGDAKYVENMKPGPSFFEKRPHLAERVKTGKDLDTVLLALYNESPRRFIADHSPEYAIPRLLEEILITRSKYKSFLDRHVFHAHARQFEESMCMLTGAVLRLLFNVEEVDTDLDIMLYFEKSKGRRPVRLKRVFEDDVKSVHRRIDHSLFLLKEAAQCVLQETERDSSFIQRILNQSYVANVLAGAEGTIKDLDRLDLLLNGIGKWKTKGIRLCWGIRDGTAEDARRLNLMMDGPEYRDLLLLARDMKEAGNAYFSLLQKVFGYFADLSARNGIGMEDLLLRLEKSLGSHFAAITKYLQFVPMIEKSLESFRRSYGQFTLIEEGQSEFYKTIIHEVSQVYINFSTSTERGKLFRKHLKSYEDFDLLYDPLYGDKIANITDPILRMRESFPAESKFNLARFVGRDAARPDAMRNAYRRILRIGIAADAILDFYGNLPDNGKYMFDCAAAKDESSAARQHLSVIHGYCMEYVARHGTESDQGNSLNP